jgi:hypothetical protein
MVFLHNHGVGAARAVRIYKTYGGDAVQVMSENPYRLARDIRGIDASQQRNSGSKRPARTGPIPSTSRRRWGSASMTSNTFSTPVSTSRSDGVGSPFVIVVIP